MEKDILNKKRPKVSLESWSEEKRIKLTKVIALLAMLVCVAYIVFDYISGAKAYLPYYLILIIGSSISLLLLRVKKYTLAKAVLIVSGITMISIFASWETRETGTFMFFLVAALAAITLFGAKEVLPALVIGTLSFVAFYITYFTDWMAHQQLELTQSYIDSSFVMNFAICLVASLTMLYYIRIIGKRSEEELLTSQDHLMAMTDELRDSRRRFELAMQGTQAGIWDWNVETDEIYVSQRLADILGYNVTDIQHVSLKQVENAIHPEDRYSVLEKIQEHFKKRKEFKTEFRFKKKDGSYLWVLDSGQAEWDENGKVKRMVGSIIDINEKKIADEQIEEQNKALQKTNAELDRFVYSTSHDLKAPLSSILGLVRIAEMTEDKEELYHCLKMMDERVEAMTGFIGDITKYARNSKLEYHEEEFNLKEVVDHVVQSLSYFGNRDKIDISCHIGDNLVVKTDKERLKVVLNNLLTNAIKYHDMAKERPYIEVEANLEEEILIMSIEDNGQGIDEAMQEKVFDMFYRANEVSDGSGLGLYIVKEVLEKIGGTISLQTQLGKGSAFTVKIPQ